MHPLSSLYVHFPHCRHLCNYCDFFKSVPKVLGDYSDYEAYLDQAFALHQNFLKEQAYEAAPIETLYMGGGTPSLWGVKGVERFLSRLRSSGHELFAPGYEWTMEINPGSHSEEDLKGYFGMGLNRASIGTQSMDGRFIKLLDRVHVKEEALATLERVAKYTSNFSVDLMLGLPFSEELGRDIERELEELLSFNPTHLSLYILTVKGNYVHREHLPSDEWIEAEFLKVSELLQARGFNHYEVSNFAKPGFESMHNRRYWEAKTVGAIGPSATGYLAEKRLRYKWPGMNLKLDLEQLTLEEAKLEELYLSLRTDRGIARNSLSNEELASRLITKGWLHGQEQLRATPRGYLMMDSIMDEIFKEGN